MMLSGVVAVHSAVRTITIAAVYAPACFHVAHHGPDGEKQHRRHGHADNDIDQMHGSGSFPLFEKAYDRPDRQDHQPCYAQQYYGVDGVHQA